MLPRPPTTVALAAASISATTASGWETIATWLDATSTVSAPIRRANIRSSSGAIAWSSAATRYHDRSDRHAGVPMTSPKTLIATGCCAACMTRALVGSTSAAKWRTKSSSGSRPKPRSSTTRFASAGGDGKSAPTPLIVSPSSSPKAAM